MIFQRYDQQWVGRFDRLIAESRLVHGFSTRSGGVSRPPYDSLNLGINTSDCSDHVRENRCRFLRVLDVSNDSPVLPEQIHGDHVAVADHPGKYPDTDAVITGKPGIALTIQAADCVPVYLFDSSVPCIGLVHAGWRGTAKQITRKTIQAMVSSFQANPKTLHAFIGPSIGPCCYAVGAEVEVRFDFRYLDHHHLDLWACNRDQCRKAGIPDSHIQTSGICTHCNCDSFFSHRAGVGQTGRMMAVMMIRDEETGGEKQQPGP